MLPHEPACNAGAFLVEPRSHLKTLQHGGQVSRLHELVLEASAFLVEPPPYFAATQTGAAAGNRTRIASLAEKHSAVEPQPRVRKHPGQPASLHAGRREHDTPDLGPG